MNASASQIVNQYIAAWKNKDADGIAACVASDVHFKGPNAETTGRDPFVAASRRMFPLLQEFRIRSLFVDADRAMFAYDFVCGEPIGVCRTAELVTIKDGLIVSSEIFFDARPFEQLAKRTSAA